ncbi:MAG: hypothetical protein ACI93R_000883 [Flavobacteriales bacterium]|jgi:hypothetical protein
MSTDEHGSIIVTPPAFKELQADNTYHCPPKNNKKIVDTPEKFYINRVKFHKLSWSATVFY